MPSQKAVVREPHCCCCHVRSGLGLLSIAILLYGIVLLIFGTYLVGCFLVAAGGIAFIASLFNRSKLFAIAGVLFGGLMIFILVSSIVFIVQLPNYINSMYDSDVKNNAVIGSQSRQQIYKSWLSMYVVSLVLSVLLGLIVLNRMFAQYKFLRQVGN